MAEVRDLAKICKGSIFNSYSRGKEYSDIHRDSNKNLMSQEMFDSNIKIHVGVESKDNKSSCIKCRRNLDSHIATAV